MGKRAARVAEVEVEVEASGALMSGITRAALPQVVPAPLLVEGG
jgi:hypothetical protein